MYENDDEHEAKMHDTWDKVGRASVPAGIG